MIPDHSSTPHTPAIPRTSQRRNRRIAGLYWSGAFIALIGLVATWSSGRLNSINALVFTVVIVSLTAFGLLTLSDDMTITRERQDEGQQVAARIAQATAFHVAYFGVIGLWMLYLFVPAQKAGATFHLGALFALILTVWLGTWIWQRWRM